MIDQGQDFVRKHDYSAHNAIIALRRPYDGQYEPENAVVGCTGCGWRYTPDSSGSDFATHLAELRAPGYLVHYWRRWAEYVELPFGQLDRDAVARELSDYSVVMQCASEVFNELAGLSKPNTAPRHVLAENEQRMASRYAWMVCEEAHYKRMEGDEKTAAFLIELALRWDPESWERFEREWAQRQKAVDDLRKRQGSGS